MTAKLPWFTRRRGTWRQRGRRFYVSSVRQYPRRRYSYRYYSGLENVPRRPFPRRRFLTVERIPLSRNVFPSHNTLDNKQFKLDLQGVIKKYGPDILVSALVAGVSAAFPPAAPFITSAYSTYGYSSIGYGLYKLYIDWKSGKKSAAVSIKDGSGIVAQAAAGAIPDGVAASIVSGLAKTSVIQRAADNARVDQGVYTEMLQGTISTTISEGIGGLSEFTVGKLEGL